MPLPANKYAIIESQMPTVCDHVPSFTERSHPEYTAEQAELKDLAKAAAALELVAVARQVDAFRGLTKKRPSDRAWVQSWPGLGSAKVWALILKSKTDGIDCAKKLISYKGVLAALQSDVIDHGYEPLYAELEGAESVHVAALRLMHHHGKDRLIIVEGTSGSGKTSCLDVLEERLGASALRRVEANDTWSTTNSTLHALLLALGYGTANKAIPGSGAAKLELVVSVLNTMGRIFLPIDEAHHMSGPALNVIKTLLNRTEVLIIIAGMDTLFSKLRAAASEEAKQLYHNRLFARIILGPPNVKDVRTFLARRLDCTQGGKHWSKNSIRTLSEASAMGGHLSFLRKIADIFIREGTNGDDIDSGMLLEVSMEVGSEIS